MRRRIRLKSLSNLSPWVDGNDQSSVDMHDLGPHGLRSFGVALTLTVY
jgi:hypothetical protein